MLAAVAKLAGEVSTNDPAHKSARHARFIHVPFVKSGALPTLLALSRARVEPLQAAVLNRLRHVRRLDIFVFGEVRNRARGTRDAVERPRGELPARTRLCE